MTRSTRLIGVVFVIILALAVLAVVAIGTGTAGASGACSVERARRVMLRERAQYREAARVFEATRYYSRAFRPDVGRWTALARECGWTWGGIAWLMPQVEQESKGRPCPEGSRDGILQITAPWHDGSDPSAAELFKAHQLAYPWDATNVRQSFLHALVMDRSNWWLAAQ